MQNEISKLYNLPDISFVDDISYEKILNEMIADYEKKYQEATGRKVTLRPGDKEHIHLRTKFNIRYLISPNLTMC